MIFNDVIVGTTSANLVPLNETELILRLGKGIDIDNSTVTRYIEKFNNSVTYRYAYVKISFRCENEVCYFEDKTVKASSLSKVLRDSKEVFLLAVTTGIAIDKLIHKTSIQNPAHAFYLDAIASASIESYINYVNDVICQDLNVTKRFSPGYADFPLEFQSTLLNRLSAKENIGIMLSNDYLMTPMKSITAVIGIK